MKMEKIKMSGALRALWRGMKAHPRAAAAALVPAGVGVGGYYGAKAIGSPVQYDPMVSDKWNDYKYKDFGATAGLGTLGAVLPAAAGLHPAIGLVTAPLGAYLGSKVFNPPSGFNFTNTDISKRQAQNIYNRLGIR